MNATIEGTVSALKALSEQYHTIAHNLANANTAGYKRRITKFVQALQEATRALDAPPTAEPTGVESETLIDRTQGALMQTDRPLDLALDGGGYFVVETPQGTLYTRNGSFHSNAQRQLVNLDGHIVAGEGGQITLPPNASTQNLAVSADGLVSAGGTEIGKLRIVEFQDPDAPIPVGGNNFQAPDGVSPIPAVATAVHQGFREASNVNVVQELVGLISVTRLYEANLKYISTEDERMKQILQVAMS